MTYDELIQLYMANGGQMPQASEEPTFNNLSGGQVWLPDGRSMNLGADGRVMTAGNAVGDRGGYDWSSVGQDGSTDSGWTPNKNLAAGSAVGAITTLGGAALGANAIGGMMGQGPMAGMFGAGSPGMTAGAGGAGASEAASIAAAENGILGGTTWGGGAAGAGAAGTGLGGVAAEEALMAAAQNGTAGTTGWGATAAGGGGMLDSIRQLAGQYPELSKLLPGLIGAGIGAAGAGDTETSESQRIDDPAFQGARDSILGQAGQVANQQYQAPGFSLTQGTPQEQTDGTNALRSAMGGGALGGTMNDTLRGAMTGEGGGAINNPMFGMENAAMGEVIAANARDMTDAYGRTVAPSYAGSSSFGNRNMGEYENADRDNLFKRVGDMSAGLRFQNYGLQAQLGENRANRAMQGVQLGQQGNRDTATMANQLFGQGTQLFGQGQQNIANQYAEFQRQQGWDQQKLASAAGAVASMPYNRTATQRTQGNRAAGALGGFTSGMQVGGLFGGQPMGSKPKTAGGLWG